ncbi:MAG: hypothetical protein Q4G33_06515 [bacterium]|nr:hypothetical protein [bacterium]
MTKNFTKAILEAKATVLAESGNEDVKRIITSDKVIKAEVETLLNHCTALTDSREEAVELAAKSLTDDMLNTFRYAQYMGMLPFEANIDESDKQFIMQPTMSVEQASAALDGHFDELNPLIQNVIDTLDIKNKQFAESMIPYECTNMAIEVIRHSKLEPAQAIECELKPYIEKLSIL